MQVTGVGMGGVPVGATAAVITVTATDESTTGLATVYSDVRPTASILDFLPDTDVANEMIAPLAANGTITVYNEAKGPSDLIIDVSGYVTGSTSGTT